MAEHLEPEVGVWSKAPSEVQLRNRGGGEKAKPPKLRTLWLFVFLSGMQYFVVVQGDRRSTIQTCRVDRRILVKKRMISAFDAVHHETFDRARTVFGVNDVALDWIRSFVSGRLSRSSSDLRNPQCSPVRPAYRRARPSDRCSLACTSLQSVTSLHSTACTSTNTRTICRTQTTGLCLDSEPGAVRH